MLMIFFFSVSKAPNTNMDFVKNFTGGEGDNLKERKADSSEQESGGGGFLSGIGNKLNAAAGGGPESEKNEDPLDKGEHLQDKLECNMITQE